MQTKAHSAQKEKSAKPKEQKKCTKLHNERNHQNCPHLQKGAKLNESLIITTNDRYCAGQGNATKIKLQEKKQKEQGGSKVNITSKIFTKTDTSRLVRNG